MAQDPEVMPTPEDLDSLRSALQMQEEMVDAAEAGAFIRERVKADLNRGLGLPDIQHGNCANCAKSGLWLASTPEPLYCPECYGLGDECTTSTLSTTDVEEKSPTEDSTEPSTSEDSPVQA